MKRLIAITTVVVLCSALFCVIVSAADPAAPTRPTKGAWSGTSTVVGSCNNGIGLLINASGTGVSTHFGKSTWDAPSICSNFQTPTDLLGTGTATITTANGDTIIMTTTFYLFGLGSTGGTWLQNITVTGGTGRFASASGEVTAFGDWVAISPDPPTLLWSGTHEGSIKY